MVLGIIIVISFMIILIVGADQFIKHWAVQSLASNGSMDFIKIGDTKIINLTYLENNGAIFGSFSGQRWILIGLTSLLIVACAVFLYWSMIKKPHTSKLFAISLMMIISGGIGNLIDRIRLGYVIDYLEVALFNFAIFNLADCFVTVGVALFALYIIFFDKPDKYDGVFHKPVKKKWTF